MIGRAANWLLTPSQRRAAGAILLLVALLALWRTAGRGPALADPLPPQAPLAHQVLTTLNANTAAEEEWAAIPGVGPAMARKIVSFRAQCQATRPGQKAFTRLEDLDQVRGIGPAMLQHLKPYLRFDD